MFCVCNGMNESHCSHSFIFISCIPVGCNLHVYGSSVICKYIITPEWDSPIPLEMFLGISASWLLGDPLKSTRTMAVVSSLCRSTSVTSSLNLDILRFPSCEFSCSCTRSWKTFSTLTVFRTMQVLCSTRMSHFRYPTLHLIVMLYDVYDME